MLLTIVSGRALRGGAGELPAAGRHVVGDRQTRLAAIGVGLRMIQLVLALPAQHAAATAAAAPAFVGTRRPASDDRREQLPL